MNEPVKVGVGVLVIAILLAVVLTFFMSAKPYRDVPTVACMSNLKQIGTAAGMYSQDNDDRFPPSRRWMDELKPIVKTSDLFHCPRSGKATGYGYAYNSRLDSRRRSDVRSAATVPMFYDSSNLQANASDPVTSLPLVPRHGEGNCIVFADNHVRTVTVAPASSR